MSDHRIRYAPITFRADDEQEGVVEGYASVFDVAYRIGFGAKEKIKQGAFADSLKERGGVVPIFYQHDWTNPIGTATASEDDHGLRVRARLFIDSNERARSVWSAMVEGALREWSIGFKPEAIERDDDDDEIEVITRTDLLEASVVVRGANPDTETIAVRFEDDDDEIEFTEAPDDVPNAPAVTITLGDVTYRVDTGEPEWEWEDDEPEVETLGAEDWLIDRLSDQRVRDLIRSSI